MDQKISQMALNNQPSNACLIPIVQAGTNFSTTKAFLLTGAVGEDQSLAGAVGGFVTVSALGDVDIQAAPGRTITIGSGIFGISIGAPVVGSGGNECLYVDHTLHLAVSPGYTFNGSFLNVPAIVCASATNTQSLRVSSNLQMDDGANMTFGTTTGTQIGTSPTQLLALWGGTPIPQQTPTGASGFADAGTNMVHDLSTWTGGIGSTAYTVGDLVAILKAMNAIPM